MPILTYSVRDQKGKLIHGSGEARTKEELIRSLQSKGLLVISVEEAKRASELAKGRRKLHKKANLDDLTLFARQMSVLLESGVTILKALSILIQQIESTALLNACKKLEEDVKAGLSLKEAVSKHPRIFSPIWIDLIETGEATGQLALVLRQLADYLEQVRAVRKKIVSALVYPIVLIIVCILAIFIFMYKVIPTFAGIYKGFGGELPFLTKMVITFSELLQKNLFKGVIILIILGYLFRRYIKTEIGRRRFDNFKLTLPILGGFFQSVAIERFATSLGMLVKGGISIVHALEVAGRATANKILEEALEKVKLNVIQGKPMSQPMAEAGIFPPLVTQMIGVGEETGKLTQILDEISKFYAEDISTRLTRLTSLFEPALLVVMGAIIGTLVVAMYLPIFKIATMAGGG